MVQADPTNNGLETELTRNNDVDFFAEYRARIILGDAFVRARIFRPNVLEPEELARGEIVHRNTVL